ncbi:MAG: sulfurtransferase TusA family protein [Actinomycetota bacterium]|nr:sulfurtransferase TusA family protein [Actinomycetota bacterium]
MSRPVPDDAAGSRHLIDGGDRACGELLMHLVQPLQALPVRTVVRLVATDPAAPLDIPAWCHLTGHRYLGAGRQTDGRPHYDLEVSSRSARVQADRPWHLATSVPPDPKGQSHS